MIFSEFSASELIMNIFLISNRPDKDALHILGCTFKPFGGRRRGGGGFWGILGATYDLGIISGKFETLGDVKRKKDRLGM